MYDKNAPTGRAVCAGKTQGHVEASVCATVAPQGARVSAVLVDTAVAGGAALTLRCSRVVHVCAWMIPGFQLHRMFLLLLKML